MTILGGFLEDLKKSFEELKLHWDSWLLLVAAVVGALIASYLTLQHYNEKVSLVCSDSGFVNCAYVTTSVYSFVPGTKLPITIPGLLFFVASGALAWTAIRRARACALDPVWLRPTHLLMASGGVLFVFYLVWAEFVKLRAICAWCTVVHILTLITFIVAAWRYQHRDDSLPVMAQHFSEATTRRRSAPMPTLSRRQRQSF